ncbi:hypothetical protein [Blastopirellula marina]|uniref:Uncharacterized protein n=1 Tax=Blastopirellula marina TaxID=124 RepID=A0A2S8GSF7_9BACT|nr:hypothetical protein [Blastopirellula marina]PQO47359.1 hypothetical protein C5Y93_04775 [Blastopirellula marina]
MAKQHRKNGGNEVQSETKPPIYRCRFFTGAGTVEAAVWDKEIGEGDAKRITHVVRVKRSWREGKDYKSSGSFWPQDLLALGEALRDCYLWITAREAELNKHGASYDSEGDEPF